KATNADATAKALACYDPIYWILGGRPKETGLDGLEPFYPRIAHAFLIGEASERFASALEGRVAYTKCGTVAGALAAAPNGRPRGRPPPPPPRRGEGGPKGGRGCPPARPPPPLPSFRNLGGG